MILNKPPTAATKQKENLFPQTYFDTFRSRSDSPEYLRDDDEIPVQWFDLIPLIYTEFNFKEINFLIFSFLLFFAQTHSAAARTHTRQPKTPSGELSEYMKGKRW